MAQLSNYQNFLTELMVGQQLVFRFEHPLLTELSGGERSVVNGGYVYTRDPNQERVTPTKVSQDVTDTRANSPATGAISREACAGVGSC